MCGETKNELNSEELEKVNGGTPPELPATQLGDSVYEGMFAPCKPIVPSTGSDAD